MGRLLLAGTSIASALLLVTGGASAAQASTVRHTHTIRHHRHRRIAPSKCEIWARTHAFAYLETAQHAAGGAAMVTARRAAVVCGGPDAWHFVDGTVQVTGFVEAGASIEVLASTGAGIGYRLIRSSRLVKYLPHDEWTRTFQLTGPLGAITALQEVYHP
jgi:hypothetical protein